MIKSIQMAVLVLVFASSQALAQDYDAGIEAANALDLKTALNNLEPLAEQGDARAQVALALMYYFGGGVPQDYAEAAKLFRLAAEQGHADAQYLLGASYHHGQGVPQDFKTAHMWYNLATSNGHAESGMYRDAIATVLTPAAIEEAQKLARECVAKDYKGC